MHTSKITAPSFLIFLNLKSLVQINVHTPMTFFLKSSTMADWSDAVDAVNQGWARSQVVRQQLQSAAELSGNAKPSYLAAIPK